MPICMFLYFKMVVLITWWGRCIYIYILFVADPRTYVAQFIGKVVTWGWYIFQIRPTVLPVLAAGVAWVAAGSSWVRFAALADGWMRPMTSLCILLYLVIFLTREFTIFVVLRHSCTYLHCVFLHYYWSYSSFGLMLFVVKTTWNKTYYIIFCSVCYVLFCSVLFCAVLFWPFLFCSILFYCIICYSICCQNDFKKTYSILFYSILFYSILFYSILFYSIPFCSIQLNQIANCLETIFTWCISSET